MEKCEKYHAWKATFEKSWCKIMSHPGNFVQSCYNKNGIVEKFIVESKEQVLIKMYKDTGSVFVDGKKVACINLWINDPDKRRYELAKEYPPPLVCPPEHFNMWRPLVFPFENSVIDEFHPDFDREGIDMWKNHLDVLCNHEQPVFEYVLRWIAHGYQYPLDKIECMITFVSGQGSGKTLFVESLKAMYGKEKCVETSSPERDCWGRYNAVMDGTLLIVLNEVDRGNSKGSEGKVKQFLTDATLMISPKFRPQYQVQSYHRFIQLTNSTDPATTDQDDRRNVIIRCSDEKKGDFNYFKNLADRLQRDETRQSIFYWLKNKVELSDWSFRVIPRTQFHLNLIEAAYTDPVEEFMRDFTSKHLEQETVSLLGIEMFNFYREWSKETGTVIRDGRGKAVNDSGLVSKLLNLKNLPQEAMAIKRTNFGNKRVYLMAVFKSRYNFDLETFAESSAKRQRIENPPCV